MSLEDLASQQNALKQQKQNLLQQIQDSKIKQKQTLDASHSAYTETQELLKTKELLTTALQHTNHRDQISIHDLQHQLKTVTSDLSEIKAQLTTETSQLHQLRQQISSLKGRIRTICIVKNPEGSFAKIDKTSILVAGNQALDQQARIFEFQQINSEVPNFDADSDKMILVTGEFQPYIEKIISSEMSSILADSWVTLSCVSTDGVDLLSKETVQYHISTEIPVRTVSHGLGIVKSVMLESEFMVCLKSQSRNCLLLFQNSLSNQFTVEWIKSQIAKKYTMFSVCCIDFEKDNAMTILERTSQIKGAKIVKIKDLHGE